MNEQEIVKQSLLEIFEKNGYLDTHLMTQRHFEHIGNEIEKKSGILISGTTIRRLSNGEFSRMPQTATLNAIATYLDFKNWQEYKLSLQSKKNETGAGVEGRTPENRSRGSVYFGLGLLAVVVSIITYSTYSAKNQLGHLEKVTFSAHKNTINDLPNTVVFNYNVDDVAADSFFVQQSWDKNRRIRIYKNNHTVTDIYYEPGYHIAKLIANDSVIKTIDVSIPTDKWFFYANEYKARYKTEYIKTDHFIKNGSLALSRDDLLNNNVEIDENKIYLYSYFPSHLEVSSDNYTLKTRVRMKEIRNNLCSYIALEVYCQRFFMVIKSTPKGCANEAALLFAEKVFGGKQNDMASIAYDVTRWNDVELVVKNKHVLIKINGKECFSTNYLNSGKLITGLSFISNGLCEIDKVDLTGLDGTVVYKSEFGEE